MILPVRTDEVKYKKYQQQDDVINDQEGEQQPPRFFTEKVDVPCRCKLVIEQQADGHIEHQADDKYFAGKECSKTVHAAKATKNFRLLLARFFKEAFHFHNIYFQVGKAVVHFCRLAEVTAYFQAAIPYFFYVAGVYLQCGEFISVRNGV